MQRRKVIQLFAEQGLNFGPRPATRRVRQATPCYCQQDYEKQQHFTTKHIIISHPEVIVVVEKANTCRARKAYG